MKESENKTTTKVCPKCGNNNLVHLSTMDKKVCTSCPKNNNKDYEILWVREENETPYYNY